MFDISTVVLFVLGSAVLGAGITALVSWIISWKGSFGDKEVYLQIVVGAFCDIAEKWFDGPGRGKEKLAFVVGLILSECEKRGIEFDKDKVTELVNKYVHDVINAGKVLSTEPAK